MNHVAALLDRLNEQNISLWTEDNKLRYSAPRGALTDSLKKEIRNYKTDIIDFLNKACDSAVKPAGLPQVSPDPDSRHERFPLSDIQQAYWIGRQSHVELGNMATQVYLEWRVSEDLDILRLSEAWQRVIARHPMLQTVIQSDGQQRVLAQIPDYQISVLDLRLAETKTVSEKLADIRQSVISRISQAEEWPLFDIRATLTSEGAHLHFCIDMIVVDGWSIGLVLDEWYQSYHRPDAVFPPLELTFRDYMVAISDFEETSALYEASKSYWFSRAGTLPAAPKLPFAKDFQTIERPQFQEYCKQLEASLWEAVKRKAAAHELRPATILLAVYAEVLSMWSRDPHFTLNQPVFHRLPLHPQVNQVVGDFTTLSLIEIDNRDETDSTSFTERARQIQQQQDQDIDHRYFGGVRLIREISRQSRKRNAALMPIVFTNLLSVNTTSRIGWGDLVHEVSQTSQVCLDHIVREIRGELVLIWNMIDQLFPEDLLNDMFDSHLCFLKQLATDEAIWHESHPLTLPERQLAQRNEVNDTSAPISDELLHTLFIRQCQKTPDNIAVIGIDKSLTYQELYQQADQVGHWLRERGARPNQLVAVIMEKGWEQVVAVMGILMSGAAYLPIDPDMPTERQHYLLEQGQISLALTQPELDKNLIWPEDIQRLSVDSELQAADPSDRKSEDGQDSVNLKPTDLAYVIYTSGSTGNPKGVVIDHRGAVNTILDINRRFGVTEKDRALALSALNFDLSVYDIFGLLAVGGTIVIPAPEGRRDPSHWSDLMTRHGVTLWDTVPALMQMLAEYRSSTGSLTDSGSASGSAESANAPLRLVMMSGDWIPLDLPDKIRQIWPEAALMSLGGATEASIWSIFYPIKTVDPRWTSIPYGKPLTNQTFHVLNDRLDPCPVWVPGQLHIGGIGLALGYWRDEEKTNASFFTHPRTGERLYKTGDLGRYLPDGNIEFLGREDFQVKIRGHRIELGEIESHLLKLPVLREVIVSAIGENRHDKQLVAYIVPTENKQELSDQNCENQAVDQAAYGLQAMQGVLTDPLERLEFKLGQPGIRQPENGLPETELPSAVVNDAAYLERQSFRQFLNEPISLSQLGQMLSCLCPRVFPGGALPKYRYGSAGSLYPVQTYLYVKPGYIADLEGGFYYYHPSDHRLILLSSATDINQDLHGGTNQIVFDQSAFSLFLVAEYRAIEPMYGSSARDFCLLEAGYMSQLLMMEASAYDLGLCPIGGMDFEPLRPEFGLTDSQEMIHSFLGGGISARQKTELIQTDPRAESLEERLKSHLLQKLPGYMVPNIYVRLSELPLTANGKVDRKALPRPDLSRQTTECVAPKTDLERRLLELVQQLLALDAVSLTDDFFDMGANSLNMVQLYNAIEAEFQREISIRDIFSHATVQMLAKVLSQSPEKNSRAVRQCGHTL
ncbi:non-ribosomal peptide synthetase [Desulfonema magnum]|uniref:Amino acid adenylation domain-containing protein n=1 Tax=Desulfonema magnum TaxID=45655 RepID=A0A975GNJ1_9BACT|nr:non-ribosomal peptide synthetase [Desulfonema magnum]QTA87822.1 Amino acid adenylation domain-containing protein [Desulfonema magnum]